MNDLGADLELRLVRYFTVVAEHLNFSRAAGELHLAQPSLSRQIQRLEHRLGVRLFERNPQGTLLTEAGKAFLPEAHTLLQAARRAELTARAYAPFGNIIIGYVEDLIITPAVHELRRRHPQAQVVTRHLDCSEERAFNEGRVDVLVARAPLFIPTDGARTTVLYEEPRVLLLPADHHLAGRSAVTLDDVDEPVICAQLHGQDPTGSFEDKLERVAGGQVVAVLPAGDRRSSLRADLATVPVEGVPASSVVVVTRIGEANPLVAGFVEAARAQLTAAAV